MQVAAPLPAPPPGAPSPGTTDEPDTRFGELTRLICQEGLLARRPVAYLLRLVVNAAFLLSGIAAFFLIGASWWTLAIAVYLAFWRVQSAFMWHDAGHKAMFRSRTAATIAGLIHANLVNGVSYGWWVGHHNKHHSHPNHLERDPDIGRRTAIFDLSQYAQRRGGQRFVVRYQSVLFFVLLTLESLKLHRTAIQAVAGRTIRRPWTEGLLLSTHFVLVLGSLLLILTPIQAATFFLLHHGMLGLYFGLLFAPNHKGMAVRSGGEQLGWLERQVLTSRNIRPRWWLGFVFGGLEYQVEHHLFPTMPRMNLARCARIVREYCRQQQLPYLEVGVVESYRQVASYLHRVSAPVRRGEVLAATQ